MPEHVQTRTVHMGIYREGDAMTADKEIRV